MSLTGEEIASQPATWRRAVGLAADSASVLGLPGERVLFLGCGTSAFVAFALATLREQAGFDLSDAAYASEWRSGRTYDRIVAITRSGTTSEVIAALHTIASDVTRVAIVGVHGSPVAPALDQVTRAVDAPLPIDPARFDHFVFLGTGWTRGLADEAALKIREAAQAWSESYPM